MMMNEDEKNVAYPFRWTIEDVYKQMEKDKKIPLKPSISNIHFLLGLCTIVPFFLTSIIPLGVFLVLVNKLTANNNNNKIKPKPKTNQISSVSRERIIPHNGRKYDVVLLGATGYTGKLALSYLANQYGVEGKKLKWAIAGRSQRKLVKARRDILSFDQVKKLDIILVDTSIRSTIPSLVQNTKCVMSTVGPFALYGHNLVEFCAKYGTHYADITGETTWVQEMISKWQHVAKETGAKLVSCCGLDCIPWDLSVLELKKLCQEQNDELISVTCLDEFQGDMSGGTVATMVYQISQRSKPNAMPQWSGQDPLLQRSDGSCSSFKVKMNTPIIPSSTKTPQAIHPRFANSWMSTFPMAKINSSIVTRSQALDPSNEASSLAYFECEVHPDFKSAWTRQLSLVGLVLAILNPISRFILSTFVLPSPGQGAGPAKRKDNFLSVSAYGLGTKGTRVESVMYFPRDAGYVDTARMLSESAICLAMDGNNLPNVGGGFFTPAVAMGDVLLERIVSTGTYFASRIVQDDS